MRALHLGWFVLLFGVLAFGQQEQPTPAGFPLQIAILLGGSENNFPAGFDPEREWCALAGADAGVDSGGGAELSGEL